MLTVGFTVTMHDGRETPISLDKNRVPVLTLCFQSLCRRSFLPLIAQTASLIIAPTGSSGYLKASFQGPFWYVSS